MSIAEKLQLIAENEQKVFDAGKQAEYDAFWNAYQYNGEPQKNISGRFFRWRNSAYNPKYDIVCAEGGTANELFNQSSIVDTKVRVDVSKALQTAAVFGWCQQLRTIRTVVVSEKTTYTNWFTWDYALKNITFEGTIAGDISFADSPLLTFDSLLNIMNALKNFTGTGEEKTRTLTLSTESYYQMMDESQGGGMWIEGNITYEKQWNLEVL